VGFFLFSFILSFIFNGAVELTLRRRRVWGRKPTAEEEEGKVKSEEADVKYSVM
jgi:hypothetical protein